MSLRPRKHLNLETAVGSRKSSQALGAVGKTKKKRVTTKMSTRFLLDYAHLLLPRLCVAQAQFLG